LLEPGVTVPGLPPVIIAATTSDPAGTAAVAPESTAVPDPLATADANRLPLAETPP